MGHVVNYQTYPENVSKSRVKEELDALVRHESREGACELPNPIKWVEGVILDTEREAREYLMGHCTGFYDQMAVRFRSYPQDTKAIKDLRLRLATARVKYSNRANARYYANTKAAFIGCKKLRVQAVRKIHANQQVPAVWRRPSPQE